MTCLLLTQTFQTQLDIARQLTSGVVAFDFPIHDLATDPAREAGDETQTQRISRTSLQGGGAVVSVSEDDDVRHGIQLTDDLRRIVGENLHDLEVRVLIAV